MVLGHRESMLRAQGRCPSGSVRFQGRRSSGVVPLRAGDRVGVWVRLRLRVGVQVSRLRAFGVGGVV
eukprot:6452672-Prymnesium_polylepis.1